MASRRNEAANAGVGVPLCVEQLLYDCATSAIVVLMTATIGFRPTEKDKQIINAAMRSGERKSDVIRRALQLLEREVWIKQARTDAERLRDEDVSTEPDAW